MAKPPSQPSANLPPLQNLPSWSRSSLERSRPPRPIVRDKLQPIKSIVTDTKFAHESMATADDSNEKTNLRIVSAPSYGHETDPYQRVVHMQNSIDFLRNQQSDILERLHAEIERLKAENKGRVLPCDRFRVAPMWSRSFCYPFLETQVRLCYDLQS